MASRRELALVALVVVVSVFVTAEAIILEPCVLVPGHQGTCLGGLSFPSIVFLYLVGILPVPIISYATYWAFSIRRALASRIYRNQALGVGLVGVSLTVLFLTGSIPTSFGTTTLTFPELFLLVDFSAVVTFYWVDTSMSATRRADPLLRNSFNWRKLRLAFWGVMVAAVSAQSIVSLQLYLIGANFAGGADLGNPLFVAVFAFSSTAVLIPAISALAFLVPAARRTRDTTLRSHLKWFGLAAFIIFFFFYNSPPLVSIPLDVVGGYLLYRSARSLAPLNRISMEETMLQPAKPA